MSLGTLMAFPVLSRVIYGHPNAEAWQRDRLTIRPALLQNYCRRRVRFVDYPGVIPQSGKSVQGTIVSGLSEMELGRLDYFEGNQYERRSVDVEILEGGKGTGEIKKALVYVWIAEERMLEDKEWDIKLFMEEKMGRWIGDRSNFDYGGKDLYLFSSSPYLYTLHFASSFFVFYTVPSCMLDCLVKGVKLDTLMNEDRKR